MGGEISPASIARAIGGRRLLLVLDNCEHLIDRAAHFVETLVNNCPRITILATSREILRVDGERVYRVSPLSVPDRQDGTDNVLEYSAPSSYWLQERGHCSRLSRRGPMSS